MRPDAGHAEALAFEARARRRIAPLVAEARAWLERSEPGSADHTTALALYSDLAALLIRIELRLAGYRRR